MTLLASLALLALVVGLIDPRLVLPKSSDPTRLKAFGVYFSLLFLFAMFVGSPGHDFTPAMESAKRRGETHAPDPVETVELDVNAGVVAPGRILFRNNSREVLERVRICVNPGVLSGGYCHTVDAIPPKSELKFLPNLFTEGGERLNLRRVKVEKIKVNAETPRGRGFWFGGY